jgi:hypothetical protein
MNTAKYQNKFAGKCILIEIFIAALRCSAQINKQVLNILTGLEAVCNKIGNIAIYVEFWNMNKYFLHKIFDLMSSMQYVFKVIFQIINFQYILTEMLQYLQSLR